MYSDTVYLIVLTMTLASLVLVLVATSSVIVTQLLSDDLASSLVFATLELGDSQLVLPRPLLISSNLTAGITQPPSPQPSPQRIAPDDDCLFNPALPKCAPIAGKCPPGFLMNEEEQCFPDKPCPPGFTRLDEDETGTCYPVGTTTPSITNGTNMSSSAEMSNST
jgi:hypothetical protein